jgi:hypothetical protein
MRGIYSRKDSINLGADCGECSGVLHGLFSFYSTVNDISGSHRTPDSIQVERQFMLQLVIVCVM